MTDRPIPEWALVEARNRLSETCVITYADEYAPLARALADAYERGQVEMRERAKAACAFFRDADHETPGLSLGADACRDAIRALEVKP